MRHIKKWLKDNSQLTRYQKTLDTAWGKDWVVFCEPSLAKACHVVKYLGRYTHRVAISNNRILSVDENTVIFLNKDYKDSARKKPVTLSGVEFLRRFCMHILLTSAAAGDWPCIDSFKGKCLVLTKNVREN